MNIFERITPEVQRMPSIAAISMSHFHMMG